MPSALRSAEWVASFGEPGEPWDAGAWLRDPDGVGPRLSFLGLPEDKVAKNRLHIDVRVAGEGTAEERDARVEAKVAELVAAGGRELYRFDGHHVTLADPEGNELCIC